MGGGYGWCIYGWAGTGWVHGSAEAFFKNGGLVLVGLGWRGGDVNHGWSVFGCGKYNTLKIRND